MCGNFVPPPLAYAYPTGEQGWRAYVVCKGYAGAALDEEPRQLHVSSGTSCMERSLAAVLLAPVSAAFLLGAECNGKREQSHTSSTPFTCTPNRMRSFTCLRSPCRTASCNAIPANRTLSRPLLPLTPLSCSYHQELTKDCDDSLEVRQNAHCVGGSTPTDFPSTTPQKWSLE